MTFVSPRLEQPFRAPAPTDRAGVANIAKMSFAFLPKPALYLAVSFVTLAGISCGGPDGQARSQPIEPGTLPPCSAPHPAPTLTAAEGAQVRALRSTYESIIAEGANTNAVANKTIGDALARGDAKTAQTVLRNRLAGPSQTMEFLRNSVFPVAISSDALRLLKAFQDQRIDDREFVDATTDSAVRATNHRRVVQIIVLENALNQLRTDLGMTRVACPYY